MNDGYYPYIKMVAKQEKFVKHIPPSHIDRLLEAAREDLMAYCIIVLMYRAGLASTEIAGLKPEDIGIYGDGIYASVAGRRGLCYIPEDAFQRFPKLFRHGAGKNLSSGDTFLKPSEIYPCILSIDCQKVFMKIIHSLINIRLVGSL